MIWYIVIGLAVYFSTCTVLQILQMKGTIEKYEVTLGAIGGILLSIIWPATLIIIILIAASRIVGKLLLDYFEPRG
jgi:hypothetical protein